MTIGDFHASLPHIRKARVDENVAQLAFLANWLLDDVNGDTATVDVDTVTAIQNISKTLNHDVPRLRIV